MILDHWEMRSIRNRGFDDELAVLILDHWEMRSIRNFCRTLKNIARF